MLTAQLLAVVAAHVLRVPAALSPSADTTILRGVITILGVVQGSPLGLEIDDSTSRSV